MDRYFLLETLFENIQDKSKILLNKKVTRVDQSAKGVFVKCQDGSSFEGDVIVGTDGVHSLVRQEMWRHMDNEEPGLLPAAERTGE